MREISPTKEPSHHRLDSFTEFALEDIEAKNNDVGIEASFSHPWYAPAKIGPRT